MAFRSRAAFLWCVAFVSPTLSAQEPAERAVLLARFRGEFVDLAPGRFTQGRDDGPAAERPAREVTIDRGFSIHAYEVTQDLWEAVMGENPSRWKGPRNSVERVSFDDAVSFCARVTRLLREAGLIGSDAEVRLPSESEWEYCARAGTTGLYSFADGEDLGAYAWYTGNAAGNDPPVGAKRPNPWGLYDIHGYLWEWCADPWHDDYRGAPGDGSTWSAGGDDGAGDGVLRGGSWKDPAERLTSSFRRRAARQTRDDAVGLRCVLVTAAPAPPPAPAVSFRGVESGLEVRIGDAAIATYVWNDPETKRPAYRNVSLPGGAQLTRNHPPREGIDRTDHASMHPGIWLAFGRLGGADFWRNRDGAVVHEEFAEGPAGGAGEGSFVAVNRYEVDGRTICRERVRHRWRVDSAGVLLRLDSEFHSKAGAFTFGDQQEMGFGVRLTTALAVEKGGRMIDSAGRVNEEGIWGKVAQWCHASGTLDGRRAGVTVMADPANFRGARFHARDYGLLVANPFGVRDFDQGEESEVRVGEGERFRLGLGVFLHAGGRDSLELDPAGAYARFVALERRP